MARKTTHIAHHIGIVFIVIGIIGLIMPLMPGWPFIFMGTALIGQKIIFIEAIKQYEKKHRAKAAELFAIAAVVQALVFLWWIGGA